MKYYSSETLQSEFKWNQKLRDCADYDKDHISEVYAPVGEWVRLIHRAINTWARRVQEPIHLPESNMFTKQTGDAVEKFKEYYGLVNYQGKIDRIVGKKTVHWLDQELPKEVFKP